MPPLLSSVFLGNIREAFEKNPQLNNLLIDDFFKEAVGKCQAGWRAVVAQGALLGIPTPALSSALAFYDGYRSGVLPANLIQVFSSFPFFFFFSFLPSILPSFLSNLYYFFLPLLFLFLWMEDSIFSLCYVIQCGWGK